MPFKFERKNIPEVIVIEKMAFSDQRGFFEEMYKESAFKESGINGPFLQDNHSFSKKGVIRGLHFQKAPRSQGKLVSVISGKILDVAVDIRPQSQFYGKWVSEELSQENHRMLWIPEGFAHGFLALEDSHVLYKTTSEYSSEFEEGIIWNDPDINVKWPALPYVISQKDMSFGTLKELEKRGEIN